MAVVEAPSLSDVIRCLTPVMLATESSTIFATCVPVRQVWTPDWLIVTWTRGMSIFRKRVTGNDLKLMMPRKISTTNNRIAGRGFRID